MPESREESGKTVRNTPACSQGERRRRAEGIPGTGAEISPQPMERTVLEQVLLKDCSPWTIHTGAGEQREEEGAAGTRCYGLTTTPAALRAGEAEELGMEEGN